MGQNESRHKRKIHSVQADLKKQEKIQIKNLILYLKELEKKMTNKPKVNRKKEIIKIREEINKIES